MSDFFSDVGDWFSSEFGGSDSVTTYAGDGVSYDNQSRFGSQPGTAGYDPYYNPGTVQGADYSLGFNNGTISLGAPGVNISSDYLNNPSGGVINSLGGGVMAGNQYVPTSSLGSIFGNIGGFLNDPSGSFNSAYDYLAGLPADVRSGFQSFVNDPRSGLARTGDFLSGSGMNLYNGATSVYDYLFGGGSSGQQSGAAGQQPGGMLAGGGQQGGGLSGLLALLGAGGAAALNGFGTEQGVTTTSQAPWLAQQPYLMGGYERANQLLNGGGPQYFGGKQVADRSADTTGAGDMLRSQIGRTSGNFDQLGQYLTGMASGPKPGIGPQTDYGQAGLLRDTIGGKFLDPETNPYLKKTFDMAAGRVQSAVDSQFAGGGRMGSGAQAAAANAGYGDLATKIYGGAYDMERGIQNDALKTALGYNVADTQRDVSAGNLALAGNRQGMDAVGAYTNLNNAALQNFGALNASGQQQDIYNQSLINAEKEKFDFEQNAPWQNLQRYLASIQGNVGSETSTPFYRNKTNESLGLASNLLGLFGKAFA